MSEHPQKLTEEDVFCYAARFPRFAGYGAISVDKPEHTKFTAKDLADWIKRGATVERVTLEQALAGMKEYLDAKRGRK